MAFPKPKVPFPKTSEYYSKSIFSFDSKEIHPIDQIDLHKQVGEIIYSTLISSAMEKSKLQVSLSKIQPQLKMETLSSLEKDTKIKSLEDLVIKLGYDPSNFKFVKDMIKRKNVDIQALRTKLKLPTTEDPQTK